MNLNSLSLRFFLTLISALLLNVDGLAAVADEELAGITVSSESGPVAVKVTLNPSQPVIGDEITLQIEVNAAAEVEVLMPEFGEALDRYTIVDFVPRQRVSADGSATFEQRYTLQPMRSGLQMIPPILIEFVDHRPGQQSAPEDLDAYEILTDRIDFTVQSVLPSGAGAELKPPLGRLEPLRTVDPVRSALWWVLVTAGLISAVAIVAVYLRRLRQRVVQVNAYQRARRNLDRLLVNGEPSSADEIAAFFVAISRIVRRYLEDRFGLRAPDLTTEEFLELASGAQNLTREHQELLQDFLRQADLVKFAGVSVSSDEVRRSSELAMRFLDETRENAPLVDESPGDDGVGDRDG